MYRYFFHISPIIGLLAATAAHGASEAFQASITVRPAVTIQESQPLNLGNIAQPTGQPAQFILSSDGSTTSTLENGFIGGAQIGEFQFQGDPGSTLSITAEPGNCTSPDVTINRMILDQETVVLAPDGSGSLGMGIDLTLAADTALGAHSCAFTVQFNYQ